MTHVSIEIRPVYFSFSVEEKQKLSPSETFNSIPFRQSFDSYANFS